MSDSVRLFVCRVGAWLALGLLGPTAMGQTVDDFSQFQRLNPANTAAGPPARATQRSESYLELTSCGAHLIDDIELPALVNGQLDIVDVVRGSRVRRNQVLARIDDRLAKHAVEESEHRLELANFQATDETPVEAAAKEIELRKTQFEKIVEPYQRGSIPVFEYLERQFQLQIAELKHINALNQRKMAEFESRAEQAKLNSARDQLERHAIMSPFDGHVFEVLKQRGEWVNAGEPVFRLARLDRVRIKGMVDWKDHDPQEIMERPVTVLIPMARGRYVELPGKIVFVSMERAYKHYEVLAEVENVEENGAWVISASHNDIIMRIHLR